MKLGQNNHLSLCTLQCKNGLISSFTFFTGSDRCQQAATLSTQSALMEKMETRDMIKLLHLKSYSVQQIYVEMKAVYGDEGPSHTTVTYWKRNFQTG